MDTITTDADGDFTVARATREDVPDIVDLLRDDEIGAGREGVDLAPYLAAFDEVDVDPQQLLAIVRGEGGAAAGTLQLTFVPGLSRGGAKRLIVEGVRVQSSTRGSGLGAALMEWAQEQGRSRGATLVQLTSDKRRADAHRFYERLGYVATHEGFKLDL
ncbi:GNAT family acetyltransferase [Janibacter sp. Soil728]|uniref:GNAT family N-acetyltransferase n=1 Tax=Janibacter sp. Soil728 TaxID=1736393 RepID=UPI0006F3D6EC|nr:GNAT family N-acetyltransferase [Janibacter sp. Soil728]KRE36064.1 GNAT family acetyltransferase [Janibacter sp. Soil728]